MRSAWRHRSLQQLLASMLAVVGILVGALFLVASLQVSSAEKRATRRTGGRRPS